MTDSSFSAPVKSSAKPTRSPLGRGLSALLGEAPPVSDTSHGDSEKAQDKASEKAPEKDFDSEKSATMIPIDMVYARARQPRRQFDEDSLESLADSIRENGMLQPILVRKRAHDTHDAEDGYEIVAGERRWRAAQRAGLKEIPILVRACDDQQSLIWALVENLQRENLNPIEEARAFRQLMDTHQLSQEQLAQALGKGRATLANSMRLLALPDKVQAMLESGRLTAGQARPLVNHDRAVALAVRAEREKLSARQVEKLAQQRTETGKPALPHEALPPDWAQLVARLQEEFRAKVSLRLTQKGGGVLSFHFDDQNSLNKLVRALLPD